MGITNNMKSYNNQIFIVDCDGNKKTLFLNENQTIKELKENLLQSRERNEETLNNNFSLFLEGKLLSESKTLVELNISSGSTFQMVRGLIGGQGDDDEESSGDGCPVDKSVSNSCEIYLNCYVKKKKN